MYRKLNPSTQKEKMNYLRKEGFTNKEIAQQLDCSTQTVWRYIGPSGIKQSAEVREMMKQRRLTVEAKYAAKVEKEEKPKEVAAPSASSLKVSFDGKFGHYAFDFNDQSVTIEGKTIEGFISVDDIYEFCKELMEISRMSIILNSRK